MRVLAALLTLSGVVAYAVLTVTPARHDYGQAVVNGGVSQVFQVVLPAGAGAGDTLDAQIQGADAGDFTLVRGLVGTTPGNYQSSCINTWRTGNCVYVVDFRPRSAGLKTATLIVADTRGNRGTAALRGTGVFGCRPHLVHCNYADFYSGTFEIHSLQTAAPSNEPVHTVGEWKYDITVHVEKGVAWCKGFVRDTSTSIGYGRMTAYGLTEGMYDGEGMIAIEFEHDDNGRLAYRIAVACPHWQGTELEVNYERHPSGRITATTASRNIAFEPADWRDAYGIDQRPIGAIGDDLSGTQRDPNDNPGTGDGVTGWVTFKWSLKRQ